MWINLIKILIPKWGLCDGRQVPGRTQAWWSLRSHCCGYRSGQHLCRSSAASPSGPPPVPPPPPHFYTYHTKCIIHQYWSLFIFSFRYHIYNNKYWGTWEKLKRDSVGSCCSYRLGCDGRILWYVGLSFDLTLKVEVKGPAIVPKGCTIMLKGLNSKQDKQFTQALWTEIKHDICWKENEYVILHKAESYIFTPVQLVG